MQTALSAPSDGYTLVLFGSTPAAINVSLYRRLPYDPLRDFTAIGEIGQATFLLSTSNRVTASSTAELIQYGQQNPGKLNCGYGATSTQVACEAFAALTGAKMTSVAYKGTPQALTDLIAGMIDVSFLDVPSALPHMNSGKLKILGVTSRERFQLAPHLPPISDVLPGFELNVFFGLAAPGQISPEVQTRLSTALNAALLNDELTRKLVVQGFVVKRSSPSEFAGLIKAEIANWATLIKTAGIPLQDN
jgi:tripartite-type tricarboxylate transporter receptor subunit TctC